MEQRALAAQGMLIASIAVIMLTTTALATLVAVTPSVIAVQPDVMLVALTTIPIRSVVLLALMLQPVQLAQLTASAVAVVTTMSVVTIIPAPRALPLVRLLAIKVLRAPAHSAAQAHVVAQ